MSLSNGLVSGHFGLGDDDPPFPNAETIAHGRFIVFERNLYAPREWIPADPGNRKSMRKRPTFKLIATEYWLIEIEKNVADVTAAILGEEFKINRIDSRHVKHKRKMGMIWADNVESYRQREDINRRCLIMAEWLERCGFWPFDL